MTTDTYASSKIKSIRAENARQYDAGKFAQAEVRFTEELSRLQEMNQALVRSKRPEKDLVKDVDGFKLPAIADMHIAKLIGEAPYPEAEPERGR